MNGTVAIALVVAAGIALWLIERQRRRRRHVFAQEAVRCPLYDCRATVEVRTDPQAGAGRRYRDVTACSLLPPPREAPAARSVHFSDLAPRQPYLCDVREAPPLAEGVACSKHCLVALAAAEAGPGALQPLDGDAWEMARRTQPPGVMRMFWF